MPNDGYAYGLDQCDVPRERRNALQRYRDRRRLWLTWLHTDEHHAIWPTLHTMVWTEVAFGTLTALAVDGGENALNNPLLAEALVTGHVATQVLAIRRLMEDSPKERLSLRSLIKDLNRNAALFTRENYPYRQCRSLNPSERALVSLAIALGDIEVESAVLILDEATASLSTADAARFLDHVRETADRGLAVLMVTHRLSEVRQCCDEMVVLQDGVTVARFDRESFDERGVVHAMVGEAAQSRGDDHQSSASRGAQARGLDIHELSGDVLQDVTLSMRPGEIIGIAGRAGGGAAELLRALAGLEPEARGRVTLGEVNLDLHSPRGPLGQGVCFISADRLNEGGIAEMTVAENLTLPKTERYGMGQARAKRDADRMIAQLDIRPSARDALFGKLSGGNQQKVILGRWLLLDPDVLLLDDPTVGVDPHTREVIFATITSLAQSGAIILIRSSEPEQLARHCTRVVVIRDGRVTREFIGADLNTEKISLATFT